METGDVDALTALLAPLAPPQQETDREKPAGLVEERHPVHGGSVLHVAAGLLTLPSQAQARTCVLIVQSPAWAPPLEPQTR